MATTYRLYFYTLRQYSQIKRRFVMATTYRLYFYTRALQD